MFQHSNDLDQELHCRRDFLRHAAGGLLGLGLVSASPTLARSSGEARKVIYLYMAGGMSHLDTLDPKPGAENQGPTGAIGTAVDGVFVSEHFPRLAQRMDRAAIVRSLHSERGTHADARYVLHTSYDMRGTIRHPSLGAWCNRVSGPLNPSLPAHVQVGGQASLSSEGFLPTRFSPLLVGSPEAGIQHTERPDGVGPGRHQRRLARLAEINAEFTRSTGGAASAAYDDIYDQALRLMGSKDLDAFDLRKESNETRDRYGRSSLGQGCLLARRLIEEDVRFVEVVDGGWDHHQDAFTRLEDKAPRLDQALAALLDELEERGQLDQTLVVLATEFGRTPTINTTRVGRDHYPRCFSSLLAGGGVVGGRVIGRTTPSGEEIEERPVSIVDFNATIARAAGVALDHELTSPSGRPFTVTRGGQPVDELFQRDA